MILHAFGFQFQPSCGLGLALQAERVALKPLFAGSEPRLKPAKAVGDLVANKLKLSCQTIGMQ